MGDIPFWSGSRRQARSDGLFDRGLCAFPLFELPARRRSLTGLLWERHPLLCPFDRRFDRTAASPTAQRRESRPHLYVIAFLILLVIQLLPYFVADGERPETYWLLLFPTAWIGAALIDLCANRCFSFGRLLDVPLLSWVGKRSYELYLIQYPILFFVQRTQPLKSQAGNSILALLLILFIGNWMYGILSQMQLRFKKGGNLLMKKHHRNIGTPISLLLIAAVMIGGTLVFLTAPGQKISDDQLQLQQELQENAEFWQSRKHRVSRHPRMPLQVRKPSFPLLPRFQTILPVRKCRRKVLCSLPPLAIPSCLELPRR